MKVLVAGHRYELTHLDDDNVETIQFVDRNHGHDTPGTNNQEVIRCLIDRVKFLDLEKPWAGNQQIIEHLRMALILHEQRHLERLVEKGTKVEYILTKDNGHFV